VVNSLIKSRLLIEVAAPRDQLAMVWRKNADGTPILIQLGTDARHASLGRTEPSEAEITAAGDALAAQGLSGWLARMQGEYYSRGKVTLEPLQPIGIAHDADWQVTLAAFHSARHRAIYVMA
jgi:hypothetical protein